MGGLWVDYDLMTTIPGLYAIGEANFSDHGANRLGASALMQGLADGYFILPYTIGDYLAPLLGREPLHTDHDAFRSAEEEVRERVDQLPERRAASTRSTGSTASSARSCGTRCGMARNGPGLEHAMAEIAALHERFKADVQVLGDDESLNQSLEKAGRVADFFELAELMCRDALHREESCGGHFREEHQTPDGEALRDDDELRLRGRVGVHAAASRILHREEL